MKKMMIIDIDISFAEPFKLLLSEINNIEVHYYNNFTDALAYFHIIRPNIVISDIMMFNLHSITFTKAILSMLNINHFILISAYPKSQIETQFGSLDLPFFQKPLDSSFTNYLESIIDLNDNSKPKTVKEIASEFNSLLNEKLIQSANLAMLGTLTSGINYEIGNALNAINGGLALIRKYIASLDKNEVSSVDKDKEKLIKAFELISNGKMRADDVIHNLSKATRSSKNKAVHRLEDILESSLATLKPNIAQIQLINETNGIDVFCDETNLYQVFTNLIKNTCDALDGLGNAKIKISAYDENNNTKIIIEDNGPEIPKDKQKSVFAPFGKETANGLYLVKNLLNADGGDIELDKEYSQGRRFIITLPQNEGIKDNINVMPSNHPDKTVNAIADHKKQENDKKIVAIYLDSLQSNIDAFEAMAPEHWQVHLYLSAVDALVNLPKILPNIIISAKNGLQFLDICKLVIPEIPRILVNSNAIDDLENDYESLHELTVYRKSLEDNFFTMAENLALKYDTKLSSLSIDTTFKQIEALQAQYRYLQDVKYKNALDSSYYSLTLDDQDFEKEKIAQEKFVASANVLGLIGEKYNEIVEKFRQTIGDWSTRVENEINSLLPYEKLEFDPPLLFNDEWNSFLEKKPDPSDRTIYISKFEIIERNSDFIKVKLNGNIYDLSNNLTYNTYERKAVSILKCRHFYLAFSKKRDRELRSITRLIANPPQVYKHNSESVEYEIEYKDPLSLESGEQIIKIVKEKEQRGVICIDIDGKRINKELINPDKYPSHFTIIAKNTISISIAENLSVTIVSNDVVIDNLSNQAIPDLLKRGFKNTDTPFGRAEIDLEFAWHFALGLKKFKNYIYYAEIDYEKYNITPLSKTLSKIKKIIF